MDSGLISPGHAGDEDTRGRRRGEEACSAVIWLTLEKKLLLRLSYPVLHTAADSR